MLMWMYDAPLLQVIEVENDVSCSLCGMSPEGAHMHVQQAGAHLLLLVDMTASLISRAGKCLMHGGMPATAWPTHNVIFLQYLCVLAHPCRYVLSVQCDVPPHPTNTSHRARQSWFKECSYKISSTFDVLCSKLCTSYIRLWA